MAKTLSDLSQEEFEHMLENMSNPEYDALTVDVWKQKIRAHQTKGDRSDD
jgi:hypothetical protein